MSKHHSGPSDSSHSEHKHPGKEQQPQHGHTTAAAPHAAKHENVAPLRAPQPAAHAHKGATGGAGVAGDCHAKGCRKHADSFNFCSEHYDHFKFGLIKKSGEAVSDYEKKFEHYTHHIAVAAAHHAGHKQKKKSA